MADLKISQLTSATLPLAGTEVLPIVQSSSTKKVATDDLTVKNVRSNATTGILQVAGPAAAATRTMTVPDANFTAARTDAGQTFSGNQQINGALGVKSSSGVVTVESTVARGSGSNYINFTDPSGNKGYAGYISGVNDNLFLWNSLNSSVVVGVNGATTWTFDTSNNLVPSIAAKGINYTANTGAAGKTSSLLNWYEEGTWTPVVEGGTTPGTGTYTTQVGSYTRIGNTVNINCALGWSAHTGTGVMIVSGLPFTAATVAGLQWTGVVFASNMDFGTNATSIVAIVTSAGTTIVFRGLVNNAARTNPTLDTSVDSLAISLTYQAA